MEVLHRGNQMTNTDINLKRYKEMTKCELIHELVLRDKKLIEAEDLRARNAANLRRLATVIFDSNDAITVQDLNGTITAWNKGAERMYGYTEAEALGMSIYDIIPSESTKETFDLIRQIKTGRPVNSLETRRITKYGRVLDVWLTLTKLTDEKGNIISIATTERDITERKRMEHELRMASMIDEMTGLYNRRGFQLFSEKLLLQAERNNSSMLLLYFDLDNLKMINDRFGHSEGDRAIKDFADILKEAFRKGDIIGRLGGDEFAVLVTGIKDPGIEQTMIKSLKEKIDVYNKHKMRFYKLNVSIGTSSFDPLRPCNIYYLVNQADRAMYDNKNRKKAIKSS